MSAAPAALSESELEHPDVGLRAERDAPVGGQAVIEGVMMRGVSNWAVAVRKPVAEQLRGDARSRGEDSGDVVAASPDDASLGEVEVSTFALESAMKRHRWL